MDTAKKVSGKSVRCVFGVKWNTLMCSQHIDTTAYMVINQLLLPFVYSGNFCLPSNPPEAVIRHSAVPWEVGKYIVSRDSVGLPMKGTSWSW